DGRQCAQQEPTGRTGRKWVSDQSSVFRYLWHDLEGWRARHVLTRASRGGTANDQGISPWSGRPIDCERLSPAGTIATTIHREIRLRHSRGHDAVGDSPAAANSS